MSCVVVNIMKYGFCQLHRSGGLTQKAPATSPIFFLISYMMEYCLSAPRSMSPVSLITRLLMFFPVMPWQDVVFLNHAAPCVTVSVPCVFGHMTPFLVPCEAKKQNELSGVLRVIFFLYI